MLRALTLERSQIKEAMGFALDNADAAGEVILINEKFPIQAIMWLDYISDILSSEFR